MSRKATLHPCRQCGTWILTGDDGDQCAVTVHADLARISRHGELAAVFTAGLATFNIDAGNRLHRRHRWHITSGHRPHHEPVTCEHRCPGPPATWLEPEPDTTDTTTLIASEAEDRGCLLF